MTVHVSSEIGRLRGVLVHSPGPELLAVTPSNRADYLYDDIIDAEAAQREHRRFIAILERFTKVYEVRDLLADVLANAEARDLLVRETMDIVPSEPLARDISELDEQYVLLLSCTWFSCACIANGRFASSPTSRQNCSRGRAPRRTSGRSTARP